MNVSDKVSEKSDMGTTIESDWENTRLLEELEAARADIENVQLVSQLHYDANLSLRQQLAAEQAKNVGLRELVEHFALIDLGRRLLPDDFGLWVLRARKALAATDPNKD